MIAGSEKAAKPTADRSQPSEGTALKHSTGPVSEPHNEYNVQKKMWDLRQDDFAEGRLVNGRRDSEEREVKEMLDIKNHQK